MDTSPVEQRNWFKLQLLLTKIEVNLRNLFKSRWMKRFGKDWVKNKQDLSRLKGIIGKDIKSFGKDQQPIVLSGEVSKWDISTVSKIIFKISDNSKKTEDGNIREIVGIRNILAHHPDKIIPREEFEGFWSKIVPISKDLGLSDFEINEIYFHNHSNEDILEEFVKLKIEGNAFFQESKFEDAIKSYSKALVLPSLTNEQLGALYSNRSVAYLKFNEVQSNKLALEDAKECKRLRPTWFKSHKRVADAEMSLKNYSSALDAFDQAIGLEPNNKELENSRSHCRILKVDEDRRTDIDPSINRTLMEYAKIHSQQSGRSVQMEFDLINKTNDILIQSGLPDGIYHLANQYRDGIQMERNLEMAAKLYAKAAMEGHFESRYEFAMCKIKGKGIKVNVREGIEMLKNLANESENSRTSTSNGEVRTGITVAQYSLGMAYQNGTGVEINSQKAISWYEKAAINGHGLAANNLACIYNKGYEVPRDEGKAIQYWKMASSANPPVPRAMENLALLYLEKGKRKEAEIYWRRAKALGNTLSDISEEEFQNGLDIIKKLEESFSKIESGKGQNVGIEDFFELTQKFKSAPQGPFSSIKGISTKEIYEAARKGSPYAKRLVHTIIHEIRALELLGSPEHVNSITNAKWEQIIMNMSECVKTESYIIKIPTKFEDPLLDTCKGIILKGSTSDLDKAARFCYSFLRIRNYKELNSFLETCISKYPEEAGFYSLKLAMLGFLDEFQKGLEEAEIYAKKFPNDWNIIYYKSVFAKNRKNPDSAIQACEDFLKLASKDQRKVPQTYYVILSMYLMKSENGGIGKFIKKIKEYFQKGLDAEKDQFPMFLPYESSEKGTLEIIVKAHEIKSSGGDPLKTLIPKKDPINLERLLLNPHRVQVIKRHRHFLNREVGEEPIFNKGKGAKIQTAPKSLVGLSEITLNEMDLTKDRIYEKMLINLQVIERSTLMTSSLQMIVEDSNRDVLSCSIYNFDRSKGVDLHFGIGSNMTLLNPYMRMANDGFPMLRVDDLKSIIFQEDDRAKKLCTFCGQSGAEKACAKCKVNYCSRECQANDWKVLDHKLICKNS